MTNDQPPMMTTAQVAQRLNVAKLTVAAMRTLRRKGLTGWSAGPPFMEFHGGYRKRPVIRYDAHQLETWIAENQKPQPQEAKP